MDATALYRSALKTWTSKLDEVTPAQLNDPTPCDGWTVRDLLNHVVGEELWTTPLVEGQTIEQVGDRFDGDLLRDDPIGVARTAAEGALRIGDRPMQGRKVHLSYGDEDAEEYLRQLAADHLVHGWDLAAAVNADRRLDPAVVTGVGTWFAEREDMYRAGGAIGPRVDSNGDPQTDLLAAFGRRTDWSPVAAALARFSAAFGSADIDAVMELCTADCVFESTSPPPDGRRFAGSNEVRAVWQELFATTTDPGFSEEESFVVGDRAVQRWRFTWTNDDGSQGHVRGVDVMRFRDGLICEKFSYVKG